MKRFDPFRFVLPGVIRRVVDGDTFVLDAYLDGQYEIPITLRLIGIDAAEKQTVAGGLLKDYLETILVGVGCEIVSEKRDPYGRNLGKLFINGQSLADVLLANLMVVSAGNSRVSRTPDMLALEASNIMGAIRESRIPNSLCLSAQ